MPSPPAYACAAVPSQTAEASASAADGIANDVQVRATAADSTEAVTLFHSLPLLIKAPPYCYLYFFATVSKTLFAFVTALATMFSILSISVLTCRGSTLACFLKSSWATPDDDRAREILLAMTVGQKDRSRGYAELSALAGKGSMLAAYVLAVRDYGDPRGAGYARAAQTLEELADRNFWPAMYQLVGSWTTKDS